MRKSFYYQSFPILITILTFFFLTVGIYGSILLLNLLPTQSKIIPRISISDIMVGFTIYLKTSIDFALFLGNLMRIYEGVQNRIALELGTSLGNGVGTLVILIIWTLFKEIPILLILMILLAAVVLLHMADEGLREFLERHTPPLGSKKILMNTRTFLHWTTVWASPFTRVVLPSTTDSGKLAKSFFGIIAFAFTIPFILGLDDFAGYIPLFSIVNILGFAIGTFLGHMLLTTALFSSPKRTVKIISHPIVVVFGSLAFVAIAGIGFFEAGRIFVHYFFPR